VSKPLSGGAISTVAISPDRLSRCVVGSDAIHCIRDSEIVRIAPK
jgi:hypothetical protein